MIDLVTLQAIARLSPKMVGYQVKRLARNRFCQLFPQTYAGYVERVAARVPALGATAKMRPQAHAVAAFYESAYARHIDDAVLGRFSFYGQSADFGSPSNVDWLHRVDAEVDFHLWRQKLAHMCVVCPMLLHGNGQHFAAVGALIQSFSAQANFSNPACFSAYWFPYSASHRILSVLSGFLIARDAGLLPTCLSRQIQHFLRWNVGFVLANIEHELRNNHVERNLAALCLYFSNVDDMRPSLAQRLDRDVAAIMHDTILADGMSAERSAMYQGLSVMALQVFSQTPFLSGRTREQAALSLKQAIRAWHFMTHPDGEIALFNDSWFDEVPSPAAITPRPDFGPVETLPDAGYGRLAMGDMFALIDAGPIGPAWNPGHGHADFLSLAVDVAGRRFIVDPGTYQYSTGPRRMADRAAAQHNGPTVNQIEPIKYKGAFRVGKLTAARMTPFTPSENPTLAGEVWLGSVQARRQVSISPNALYVEDTWCGAVQSERVRLHVSGDWALLSQDRACAVFRDGNIRVRIAVRDGHISSYDLGNWSCQYLRSRTAHVLDLQPNFGKTGGARLIWSIARMPL